MTDDAVPRLGFGLPVSGPWATPEGIRHVATRAEALGYAGLWTFQRLLSPVGRDLGPGHASVLDPVLALTVAAGVTDRIGLGTATVCAPFVPPMVLAKQMATLDVLSRGRLTVGVGMGWLPEEYAAAGIPFRGRGARFEEYLHTLVALWTEDPVEVAGELYEVPRSRVAPAPVQRPHPPVLVGGTAEPALRRAGRLAQGWIAGSGHDRARLAADVATVRAGAEEAGRDPDELRVLLRVVPGPDPARVAEDLAALGAAGVTEVLVDLNLSPAVVGAGVSTDEALEHAERVLEGLAPGGRAR